MVGLVIAQGLSPIVLGPFEVYYVSTLPWGPIAVCDLRSGFELSVI